MDKEDEPSTERGFPLICVLKADKKGELEVKEGKKESRRTKLATEERNHEYYRRD